ncbi:hypothetical protein ABIB28_003358 [Sphingomonas sp. UYEF23]
MTLTRVPSYRHPGLVPGSTVPRADRLQRVRAGGPRNTSGVTEVAAR